MTDCGSSHSHSHGQQHLHRTDLSLDKKEELSDILQIVLTGYKNTIPAISVLSKLLLLTLAIAIIQMSVGLWSNNLLLLCHSAHSTFDSFQLLVAVLSSVVKLSKRSQSATQSFSYGLQRLPILGAFSNATLGILVSLYLLVEALHRYSNGESSSYHPITLISITTLSLCVKMYGIITIQNITIKDGKSSILTLRAVGSACRHVFQLFKLSSNNRRRNKRRNGRAISESSLDLILTMTVGDVIRGIGLLFACLISSEGSWFIYIDMSLAFFTCIFILLTVWPIFCAAGNILLQRLPVGMKINTAIRKCITNVASERGVLEIKQEHFWMHTDDLLIGSVCILVDGEVNEQMITCKVHDIFQAMNLHLLTVEVVKEKL